VVAEEPAVVSCSAQSVAEMRPSSRLRRACRGPRGSKVRLRSSVQRRASPSPPSGSRSARTQRVAAASPGVRSGSATCQSGPRPESSGRELICCQRMPASESSTRWRRVSTSAAPGSGPAADGAAPTRSEAPVAPAGWLCTRARNAQQRGLEIGGIELPARESCLEEQPALRQGLTQRRRLGAGGRRSAEQRRRDLAADGGGRLVAQQLSRGVDDPPELLGGWRRAREGGAQGAGEQLRVRHGAQDPQLGLVPPFTTSSSRDWSRVRASSVRATSSRAPTRIRAVPAVAWPTTTAWSTCPGCSARCQALPGWEVSCRVGSGPATRTATATPRGFVKEIGAAAVK